MAQCKEPMCCQGDSGLASRPDDAAQPWGDYRKCDLSLEMIQNAFTQANTHVRIFQIVTEKAKVNDVHLCSIKKKKGLRVRLFHR